MEWVNFLIDDVLENLSNLLGMKIEEKQLELLMAISMDIPRYLVGDPLRLEQILINLTSNAIKFSSTGEIVIRIKLVKQVVETEQVELCFSVQDTGICISQPVISSLFEAFIQADGSTTRKFGGTGLGLAICKRLVKMMGGDIQVESELGNGSIFSFTALFGVQKEQTEKILPPTEMRGLRTLIVDDNKTSTEILQEELSAFSFEVSSVNSGEAALAELAAAISPYDLVLLDWKMPGIDGIETARRIKKDLPRNRLPMIIMVTAFSRADALKSADKTSIDAFLIKPVLPSLLFDTIMEVFGKEFAKTSHRRLRQSVTITTNVIAGLRGARILLVEDNAINQLVATEILESAGLNVEIANNGQEAVAAVTAINTNNTEPENRFDAILMDVQMPEMDGYEATRLIREKTQHRDFPIIAMTAHAMIGDREKCLQAGMNDYITKPIEVDQLLTVLGNWIKIDLKNNSRLPVIEKCLESQEHQIEEILPDDLPGIDIKSALNRLRGNRKLFKRLLNDFYQNYRNAAHDIRMALNEKDVEKAQLLVHTLKGIAGNLSALCLQDTARDLENALRQKYFDNVNVLIDKLENSLTQLLDSPFILKLKTSEMEEIKPSVDPTPVDTAVLAPLLIELASFINNNSTYAEKSLATVKEHLNGAIFTDELKQLEDCLSRFDFQAAQRPLNSIAQALDVKLY